MAMASSMEDEVQKRNTDCVYFLASPLTCKKGSECEYRHSETARLNPRDCWYWLSGNCLNPTCAFRHPPLEGVAQTPSDSAYLPPHSIVPTSKTNVPCYFYFNAFCIKGDQCPFLHGQNDILPAQKFPKVSSEGTSAQPQENKTSTGSDTGPASVEVPTNPSEGTSKETINQFHSEDVLQPRVSNNILDEPSPSPELPMLQCEEPAVRLFDEPLPTSDFVNSRAKLCSDQSSEELVKDRSEPEEWWESSPGFDVLVDDGSEQLAFEDDADYLLVRDRESERLHNHLLQYDYEGSAGYDPTDYPDPGFLYKQGLYDSYDNLDDGYTPDYMRKIPEHSRERVLEPMFPQKRRLLSRERHVEGRDRLDLRDHLRKRRRMDVHQVSRSSQKHRSSSTNDGIREQPMRHGMGRRHHGRLPLEFGKNMIGSLHSENESAFNENYWSRRSGHSQSSRQIRSRRQEIESRRGRQGRVPLVLSSEIPKGIASKESKLAQTSTNGFTGPKTLRQIKEEKRRAKAHGYGFGNHIPKSLRKDMSNDFQGPKPLSELLKDKRKHVSVNENMNGSAHKHELADLAGAHPEKSVGNGHLNEDMAMPHHGTSEKLYGEYESDFFDDENDDDDDDTLAKKLECIFRPA